MQLPPMDFEPTMPVFVRRAADVHGDNDFVVMIDRRLSYRQAEERSRLVAKQLLAAGAVKGTRIAIQFGNTTEFMIAFLAVTRIGAVVIPLSTAYKPAELRKALRHSDTHTLIVPSVRGGHDNAEYIEHALPGIANKSHDDGPYFLDEAPYLRRVLMCGPTDRAWAEPIDLSVEPATPAGRSDGGITEAFLERVEAEVTPADWIMFVYTSGTTAEPKGVVHTHGNYIRHNSNLSQFIRVTPSSKTFAGMPWFWIGGLGLGIGNSMYAGFPLISVDRFDPKEALELIKREKPVTIGMWAQLLQRFREYVAASGEDVSDVPVLSAAPADMGLRHLSLGQTESFGPHTHGGPEAARILPEEMRGSFGYRVPYVEHKIVNPDTLEELPDGVDGELLVRGYSILAGQYKRERHEAFTDDGWLRTGDKCQFREGVLYFRGRVSEMIKTSGSNVAPREVELVLETFPEIALAVVLGIPDERRGEAVACVLVPAGEIDIDVETIRKRADEELSNYKVPIKWMILRDDELPTLGSGKPDKVKLREMLEHGGLRPTHAER